MKACVLVLACACGGATPAPATPAPPGPEALAARLHDDLAALAAAAHDQHACAPLSAALRPIVAQMRRDVDTVHAAQQDPAVAVRLRSAVAAYDERDRGLADAAAKDLAATFLACPGDRELEQIVEQIPSV
ncbi:MAG TPA: hypothetical protein VGM88_24440 [Kofleriaceae bacterium]